MQSPDYGKISITAKLVAYVRQYCDIPFAEDVATHIKAAEAVQIIAQGPQRESPAKPSEMPIETKALATLIEARYKSTAELIQKTGIQQVLELASGFSMRGLAMSTNQGLTYVETDLPEINAEKNKLVSALRAKYDLSDIGNYHIATANALDRTDLEAATASLNHDQALLVVNEGLMPYLLSSEQETLASNIFHLLSKFAGGAWITPDFTTKEIVNRNMSEERKRFRDAVNRATDRPLHEGAFESEEAICEFVNKHGFTGVKLDQMELVTALVSPERVGLPITVVERLKPSMTIWHLTPQ